MVRPGHRQMAQPRRGDHSVRVQRLWNAPQNGRRPACLFRSFFRQTRAWRQCRCAARTEHAVGIGLDLVEHRPDLALRTRRLQGVAHGARRLQGQKKLLAARQLGRVGCPAGAGKTSQRQGTSRWRQPPQGVGCATNSGHRHRDGMISPAGVVVAAHVFLSLLGLDVARRVGGAAGQHMGACAQAHRQHKLAPGKPAQVKPVSWAALPRASTAPVYRPSALMPRGLRQRPRHAPAPCRA